MKRKLVAICGKGGAGKTTISAIIARLLYKDWRYRALFVDADPAGGLCTAIKISVKSSIEEVRRATASEIKKATNKRDLLLSVDYFLMEAITEVENLAFLWIGRPLDKGCYCKVNSLLKDALGFLANKFPLVIIDAEAGIEQINRNVMERVEHLIIISDCSVKGLTVAEAIAETAKRVSGINSCSLLFNRVSEEEVEAIKTRTTIPIIGWTPEDKTVQQFDMNQISFLDFPSSAPICGAVGSVLNKILFASSM